MGLIGIVIALGIGMSLWFFYPVSEGTRPAATVGVEAVAGASTIKDFSTDYDARLEGEMNN